MRKPLLFVTALFVFCTCFAAETDGGNITSVSLYRNGATINREFTVRLNKGDNTVTVRSLPSSADANSIRISPKDPQTVRITGADAQKTYLNADSNSRIASLTAQRDTLDAKIARLTADADAQRNSIAFLKSLNPFAQGKTATQAEIDSYISYMEKTQAQKNDKIAAIAASIKTLKEQRDSLQKEIDAQTGANGQTLNMVLSANAQAGGDETFEISYNITGAGWEPAYDIRTSSATGKTEITAYAMAHQSMGEDWKNVSMEISTLMPTTEQLPDLNPWYLDIYKPRPLGKSAYYELEMMPRAAAAAPQMAEEPMPVQTEDATSFSFILPSRATLPADGQPHRIILSTASVTADMAYYAVPKLSDKAFLTAKFKNPFSFPLVAGTTGIYLDGKMVSAAEQAQSALPGADMEVSLGADNNIKIERKLARNEGSSGIFGKTVKAAYDCEITINNKKSRTIDISVDEATPVSRNDQIKVTIGDYTKDGSSMDDDGIITWKLKVKPSQTAKLKLGYKIEYPEDANVSGL